MYNKVAQLEVCGAFSGRGMGMNITAQGRSGAPQRRAGDSADRARTTDEASPGIRRIGGGATGPKRRCIAQRRLRPRAVYEAIIICIIIIIISSSSSSIISSSSSMIMVRIMLIVIIVMFFIIIITTAVIHAKRLCQLRSP